MFKKAGLFFLIVVFVMSITGAAFAAPPWLKEDSNKIPPGQQKKWGSHVFQKQDKQSFRVLERKQIRVRGKELKSDLPPVIKQGRTLIPVRAVVMGLAAWVGTNSQIGHAASLTILIAVS